MGQQDSWTPGDSNLVTVLATVLKPRGLAREVHRGLQPCGMMVPRTERGEGHYSCDQGRIGSVL